MRSVAFFDEVSLEAVATHALMQFGLVDVRGGLERGEGRAPEEVASERLLDDPRTAENALDEQKHRQKT